MAWNEPGGGKKDKDKNPKSPWGGGGGDREPGPPDLDQLFRKLMNKLKSSLGQKPGKGSSKSPFNWGDRNSSYRSSDDRGNGDHGDRNRDAGDRNSSDYGSGNSSGNGSGNGSSNGNGSGSKDRGQSSSTFGRRTPPLNFGNIFAGNQEIQTLGLVVLIVLVVLYILAGIYIVDPPERAVITRFGKYVSTEGPGPHWLPVFIEDRQIVNVEQVATSDQNGSMLTKDRNIASVGIAVQYRIGDGEDDVRSYLFNVVNPVHSLRQSAESALRQVIGQYTMDEVLTYKRAEIAQAIKEQIIETLKNYQTGILVLDVSMQYAKAPDEVRAAFDDVIKAAADEERLINQARAYENEVIPRARGMVERLKNEALAYKQQIILRAEGNVQRFNLILPEYQKAPKVTQTRLYLDTMEQVLKRVTKVVSDPNAGNNYIYVPSDRSNQENVSEESEYLFGSLNNKESGKESGAKETPSKETRKEGLSANTGYSGNSSNTSNSGNSAISSNGRYVKEKSS